MELRIPPVKRTLTDRQQEIYYWIDDYIHEHGYPPTRKEISEGTGMKSPNAAQEHLMSLERKGWIRVAPAIARGITVLA